MSFNIKQPEVDHLAREVAAMAGLSLTDTVGESLKLYREKLEQKQKRKSLSARLMDIAKECRQLPVLGHGNVDDLLYDERGLPK